MTTVQINFKRDTLHCDCEEYLHCDCDDHAGYAITLDGAEGYGQCQWVVNPRTNREVLQVRSLWGEYEAKDVEQAAEELRYRLAMVNADAKVHGI